MEPTKEIPVVAKGSFDHDEKVSTDEATDVDSRAQSEQMAREIRKRIDLRLLPVLTVLYLLSYVDRSNIANARIAGLDVDLGLTDKQYNNCLMIFFFPYALFEIPSNMMLKRLRPSIWLPIIVLIWGISMTLMGIVRNYSGLLVTRFFLGAGEAGFFPGASFILTQWYCRHEMQTRLAIFFCAASLAGAFSGLLAFALMKMDSIAGLEGWRWIFLIEGLATVAIGLILPFILIDFPQTAKFMSQPEKDFYCQRIKADYHVGADEGDKFKWKYLQAALFDWKIHLGFLVSLANGITGYGFVFSMATSIKQLGYSASNAQLLTIPVYFTGLATTMIISPLADRYRKRSPFIIYPLCVSAIGFIAVMALPKTKWPGARYGALFPIAAGIYLALPSLVTWNANNLAGSWKRAIGIALQLTLGNLGGVAASHIFIAKEAPTYWTGYGVSFAILMVSIASAVTLRFLLGHLNKQREKMTTEEINAKYTPEQLADMGDYSPFFRYTL